MNHVVHESQVTNSGEQCSKGFLGVHSVVIGRL